MGDTQDYHDMLSHLRSLIPKHQLQRRSLLQASRDLYLLQSYRTITPFSFTVPHWDQPLILLRASKAKAQEDKWFLPIPLQTDLSVPRISGIFKAIQEHDPIVQLVTMAIVESDSSVVYYEVRKGIVPPKEIKGVTTTSTAVPS